MEEPGVDGDEAVVANHKPPEETKPGECALTIQRRRYRRILRPSWCVAFVLFERARMIGSIPRWASLARNGLLSYPRSRINRSGRLRGRPGRCVRPTRTVASVASRSLTSAGDAESRCTPIGVPWPSTRTIHFVPLPRLVFPTQSPLFWALLQIPWVADTGESSAGIGEEARGLLLVV